MRLQSLQLEAELMVPLAGADNADLELFSSEFSQDYVKELMHAKVLHSQASQQGLPHKWHC